MGSNVSRGSTSENNHHAVEQRRHTTSGPSAATSDGAASVNKKIRLLGNDWASISADEYYSPDIIANKMFPFPKNTNTVSIRHSLFN